MQGLSFLWHSVFGVLFLAQPFEHKKQNKLQLAQTVRLAII